MLLLLLALLWDYQLLLRGKHVHALCRAHHPLTGGKAKGAALREASPRQRQQGVVGARHRVAAGPEGRRQAGCRQD
jgi:hypothetical protein